MFIFLICCNIMQLSLILKLFAGCSEIAQGLKGYKRVYVEETVVTFVPTAYSPYEMGHFFLGGVCLVLTYCVVVYALSNADYKYEMQPDSGLILSLNYNYPPKSQIGFTMETTTNLPVILEVHPGGCFINLFDPLDERLMSLCEFLSTRNICYVSEGGKQIEVITRLWP